MPPKPSSSYKGNKRVRMRDVAERCGVSISTVSLVLSGDSRIPEDTVRKVLQAVKALEYRPSAVARNLARRSSRTIGVILPEFALSRNQPYYYQALEGIHSQTQSAGFKIIVEAANRVFLERRYYLRLLKEQSADGIIYMAAGVEDGFLREMEKEHYPFVLLDGMVDGVELPSIRVNDYDGARMATRHLISLGHKQIGHVAGFSSMSMGRDREKGYRDAMHEAGLPISEKWIVRADYDMKSAEEATAQLMQEEVAAIFAGSDTMAYGVARYLKNNGKRVPEDVALIGMDDLNLSEWFMPSLTTVRCDITKISAMAAKYLITQIQSPLIHKDLLAGAPEPELVIRSSCGANK